jgi:hypothetical protein
MDRSNPYEAAFEAYLKAQELCYVAVDETRRSTLGETPIKNLDFIVFGANGRRLLVDVKGRRFPGGTAARPRYVWESWAEQDDIDGLRAWTQVFGPGCVALFVFVYRIERSVQLDINCVDVWNFREQTYLLRAVAVDDYIQHMRVRSPKWGTVCVGTAAFRELARPFCYFTHALNGPAEVADGKGEDWGESPIAGIAAQDGRSESAAMEH